MMEVGFPWSTSLFVAVGPMTLRPRKSGASDLVAGEPPR